MSILLNYPLFHADDDNGAPLTGGLLYSYIAGSSTEKATYTTRPMTTANANPVVLNSRGEAVIYGAGLYKLMLKTSAGVTIWTQDNVELGPGQGAYSFFADPSETDHGAAGSGSSLYDILTALGTDKKATVYFPHNGTANTTAYAFGTTYDASSYSNVTFDFENGALPTVANGITLTLPAPANIRAGLNQQIFSLTGTGKVVFSKPGSIAAKWFSSASACSLSAPRGSEIVIDGDYDVADYGVFSFTVPVHITGAGGWSRDNTPDQYGARIINSGGDVVDSPVITFSAASAEYGASIRNLSITHEGTTSYAIASSNIVYLNVEYCDIECTSLGYGGITLTNASYFFKCNRTKIRNFTTRGVSITGTGAEYVFTDCHVQSSVDSATGIYSQVEYTKVYRGEVGVSGATATGIYLYNANASSNFCGGIVSDVFFEGLTATSYGIVVSGNTKKFTDIMIEKIRASLSSNLGTLVYFDKANYCKLLNPQIDSFSGGGTLINFGENSLNCELVSGYNVATCPLTVHASATNATKTVSGVVSSANITNITTSANLTTTLINGVTNLTHNFVPMHNGTGWNYWLVSLADDAASSFTLPTSMGIATVMNDEDPKCYGLVAYEAKGAGADSAPLTEGADFEVTTGALAGTTGNDNKVTFSVHTDGKAYLEARKGAAVFTVLFSSTVYGI